MKNILIKNKNKILRYAILGTMFYLLIFLSVFFHREVVADSIKQNLQVWADEKALLINNFLNFKKEELMIISSMNVFKEAIKHPDDELKIKIAEDRINELKKIIPGISLMNNQGIVAIGDIDLPGTDYSQHPYYSAKRQDTIFTRYYDPLRKKDYYAIIGPIYDYPDKSKLIGRIAFDIELDKISDLMKEIIDNGNDEVYLIDENGLLLSKSEYIDAGDKNGVMIQEIKSDGAIKCLNDLLEYGRNGYVEEHKEEISRYLNYMGNEVLGAHAYTPAINGCVIAEENINEVSKFSFKDYITSSVINFFNNKQ